MQTRSLLALATALALALVPAHAIGVTFIRIADTSTAVPGGSGNFGFFEAPALDAGTVAFQGGASSSQSGVYTGTGGPPALVADENTNVPGDSTTFNSPFDSISTSGGQVAFTDGIRGTSGGVYTNVEGSLTTVADTDTPVPGGTGNFDFFNFVSIDGSDVAFVGRDGDTFDDGIYTNASGSLTMLVDNGTPAPHGTGGLFFFNDLTLASGSIAFFALNRSGAGVYTNLGGSLQAVAFIGGTPVPGGGSVFVDLGDVSFDGASVSFSGSSTSVAGVYSTVGGSLDVVADTNTLIPGSAETFLGFQGSSVDGGNVAFLGETLSNPAGGIYVSIGGLLVKVIEAGDELDGRTVSGFFELDADALSGNQLAFRADFTDGTQGVYLATIPEPATGSLLGLGLSGLAAWRRRQQGA